MSALVEITVTYATPHPPGECGMCDTMRAIKRRPLREIVSSWEPWFLLEEPSMSEPIFSNNTEQPRPWDTPPSTALPERLTREAFARIRAHDGHAIDDSYGIATREVAAAIRAALDEAARVVREWEERGLGSTEKIAAAIERLKSGHDDYTPSQFSQRGPWSMRDAILADLYERLKLTRADPAATTSETRMVERLIATLEEGAK